MARQGLPVNCDGWWWDAKRRRSNVLDGGVVWGTALKVIVRERRSVTRFGVAVALVCCL